jgi:hypothetical protein
LTLSPPPFFIHRYVVLLLYTSLGFPPPLFSASATGSIYLTLSSPLFFIHRYVVSAAFYKSSSFEFGLFSPPPFSFSYSFSFFFSSLPLFPLLCAPIHVDVTRRARAKPLHRADGAGGKRVTSHRPQAHPRRIAAAVPKVTPTLLCTILPVVCLHASQGGPGAVLFKAVHNLLLREVGIILGVFFVVVVIVVVVIVSLIDSVIAVITLAPRTIHRRVGVHFHARASS